MLEKAFIKRLAQEIRLRMGSEYVVEVVKIPKNNGVMMTGLSVRETEGKVAPIVEVSGCFEEFLNGKPMDEIVDTIIKKVDDDGYNKMFDAEVSFEFDEISDKIVFRVVNRACNKALLSCVPHKEFLDLAIVFYLNIHENDYGKMTALINNSCVRKWNVTVDELYELAFKNTPILEPECFQPMNEVMREMIHNGGCKDCGEEMLKCLLEPSPLHVLSNRSGLYGASVMLYPGVLKQIAEILGGDLLIIPSSIHEELVMRIEENEDIQIYKGLLRFVNVTEVAEAEILSDEVYVYSMKHDKLILH